MDRIENLEEEVRNLKSAVSSIINHQCEDDYEDEDDDICREYDDWREQQEEELLERAWNCKCGAWHITKSGGVVHVADCCCGAE